MSEPNWKLFLGNQEKQNPLEQTPDAPPWRTFMSDDEFRSEQEESDRRLEQIKELAAKDLRGQERGKSFRLDKTYDDVQNAVNAAIHLRRPLLVTGKPGAGKTSLAYAIAYELQLGIVLTWAVNARAKLVDALYQYDAVARLQDAQLTETKEDRKPIGEYISLGAVGTAFLPSKLPRVLLIDEIDKCDINLPNDLLNLFEEGSYEIPELVRYKNNIGEIQAVEVRTADADMTATIKNGRVCCKEFPIVIMTSNGERDFPPAFLRRCVRVRMPDPSRNSSALKNIVQAHFQLDEKEEKRWSQIETDVTALVENFTSKNKDKTDDIATDQLLNVVYLLTREVKPDIAKGETEDKSEQEKVMELLLKGLSEED